MKVVINGGLASLTDDNGNKTEWTYDCQGRKLTEKKGVSVSPSLADRDDPDTTISWAYNKDSQVTKMTREDGTWVNYTYDDGGQVTQITITNTPTGYYGTTQPDSEYAGLDHQTELLGARRSHFPGGHPIDPGIPNRRRFYWRAFQARIGKPKTMTGTS